jgi:signal transduction histidine kinase
MEYFWNGVIFAYVNHRAGNRVLVVDDDVALTKRIERILTREGYTALAAYGPDEAEEIARSEHPHLVITDFHMPGRSGLSLLAALRAYAPTQEVPVILLTGESWESVGNEGHSQGLDVFLKKPLDVDVLLNVVARQLQRAQAVEDRLDSFRSRVTTMIPHELRTPLAGIIGLGSLLSQHAQSLASDPNQIETFGKAVLSSGERLRRLVESYLLYVQLEAGMTLSLNDGDYDVRADEEIAAAARRLAARYEREPDLVLRHDGEPLMAVEDESALLVKIAEELVDNAWKFSQPGTEVTVSTSYRRDKGHESLSIAVRDHGRGMNPIQIAGIGPFVQFERERYEQQGSGLGLSLAQRLAEAIGASLHIVAPEDGGLSVTLTRERSMNAN